LKVKLLLDGGAPKVPPEELKKVIAEAGMDVGEKDADFGLVVGGDGRFSLYGRTEDIPLLFVGVRAKGASGSKAHLAHTTFDRLSHALKKIRAGEFAIEKHKRLGVFKNGIDLGEVFTDVYLQRGSEGGCIRYKVRITGLGVGIDEAAIADGVVISTSAGATGYYSYPDRIRGSWMDPSAFARIGKGKVGVCHINPTFTEREGTDKHPLRYVVQWGSRIELSLFRDADARLYGTTEGSSGVKVSLGDVIAVVPGKKTTNVMVFRD
jgi:hypothetical protein